jgi:ferredoxin
MPNIPVDMDACQSHGQGEFAAEAIFQLDDDGEPRYRADSINITKEADR